MIDTWKCKGIFLTKVCSKFLTECAMISGGIKWYERTSTSNAKCQYGENHGGF